MKIAMTGASGFVGRHLSKSLRTQGHRVVAIDRQDLSQGSDHLLGCLSGCEVVINLAGAPINKRWTASHKRQMVSSRVDTTRALVMAMGRMDPLPKSF
ncbi:MAG: NAD-dependent epimerase/dehydratase family protein, partial [Gammaproteobacteria bacterium]|nr:NAD-dependent epimerase/dehydratase family protein [Gammaproteobacteria bacterium]